MLFADEDARCLITALLERSQPTVAGCLRAIRWRPLRDPRRDTLVRAPDATLRPFLGNPDHRFLVLWDHGGCGREREPADAVERDVKHKLLQAGATESTVDAIAFVPELETTLVVAWRRVVEVLSKRRPGPAPSDAQILLKSGGARLEEQLERDPKEVFDGLLRCLNLRHSAELFLELGEKISIPTFKAHPTMARISGTLRRWFPP
ncbi:MAG: hypothetical protein JOZ69_04885 [Myxococcales bacterium]|nr:hypothetical protein [Myxococcales bacterium]